MDLKSDFLTQQIIAYIGNKRRLLGLIEKSVHTIYPNLNSKNQSKIRFLDLFAGSSVVSRLAKELNFEIYANDWEQYSYILSNAFIKTNSSDIVKIFGSEGEFNQVLDQLNKLPDPSNENTYIAKYYAPQNFEIMNNDFKTERLFYTRQNALIIDKIRNYIEEHFSSRPEAKNLLIGILLYEAATHTNTSGVFKAYHKGFGGHNGDAIKRIITPIQMKTPVLIDSDFPVYVFREDANTLVRKIDNIDIAYLDPPYNQHQYGSNYHMLNTIALWDKIPASSELNDKGVLKEKAAIRKDWIKTRSSYCYRESAISSFSDLIENLDAKHILISYSTDGIIPFEVMKDICTKKGQISIVTNEYTKYRGGKQSNSRLNTNIEFILVVDSQKKSTPESVKKVDAVIAKKRLLLMFKQKYSFAKIKAQSISLSEENIIINTGKRDLTIPTKSYFELFPTEEISQLSWDESDSLYAILSDCVCLTKEEELEELIFKVDNKNITDKKYFLKLIPCTLKKLAHKKNKERFYYWLNQIKLMDLYPPIKDKIEAIEILAEKRFRN